MKTLPFFRKLFLLSFTFFLVQIVIGQNYFKVIDNPEGSYFQNMDAFSNGDILIGDKVHDVNQPFAAKNTYLIRVDECGEVIWANTYQKNSQSLDFIKIATNDAGEIYVMANYGGELQASVLKIAGEDGTLLDARLFNLLDYKYLNNYSLQEKDGRVMIFKFFETDESEKYSHLIMLDENLNLLWTKKFAPYTAYGESLLTDDLGVLYYTGNTLVKTDANGNVQWAKEIEDTQIYNSFSSPLQVTDGFVSSVYFPEGAIAFFKIDLLGNLVWQTKKVPAHYHVPKLQLLSDDQTLAIYNTALEINNVPAFLTISPDGILSEQKRLNIDYIVNSGFTYFRVAENRRVTVLGNLQMDFQQDQSKKDFLLQFDWQQPDSDCFSWDILDEAVDNTTTITLTDLAVTSEDFMIAELPINTITTTAIDPILLDICAIEVTKESTTLDSLLDCSSNWTINLPHEDFIWEDGSSENPRTLKLPGTYKATKSTCLEEITYEYLLSKEECNCEVFIPNVISPNQDGINDELEIFSGCEITQIEMSVYNRWGGLVFTSNSPTQFWKGDFQGKKVNPGVYVLKVNIQTSNGINEVHQIEKYQTVMVL